jgi:hypothetical protein
MEVGRLTLDRNPTDFHTRDRAGGFRAEQPGAGIGPSPDKMLLARLILLRQTPTALVWASTTSRSRSTGRRCRCTATARTGRCASKTSPIRSTRPTQRAARGPTVIAIPRWQPGVPAGIHPRRLHPAQRRRRFRTSRHFGARGHGRCSARSTGVQRGGTPQERCVRAGASTRARVLAQY